VEWRVWEDLEIKMLRSSKLSEASGDQSHASINQRMIRDIPGSSIPTRHDIIVVNVKIGHAYLGRNSDIFLFLAFAVDLEACIHSSALP
jgi:hypothetical protein